jgi:hypothetical protein
MLFIGGLGFDGHGRASQLLDKGLQFFILPDDIAGVFLAEFGGEESADAKADGGIGKKIPGEKVVE